ncbi:hypothetical protein JCM33374_g5442 [Metschnikowia sp. JCM 33374]|nr:hypothetical protein JCM33374_g5442 [Metschnikowia sp. JCM 33374]
MGHPQDSLLLHTPTQSSKFSEKQDPTLNVTTDAGSISFSRKNLHMSDRFPFNRCIDLSLRESKHSLNTSLRTFILERDSIAFMRSLRSCLRDFSSPPSGIYNTRSFEHRSTNENGSSVAFEAENNNPDIIESDKIVSILVPPNNESQSRLQLILYLNECFYKYLTDRASIDKRDSLIEDTVNYITNLFIQEFPASGTKDLCLKILEQEKSGELDILLSKLIDEAEENHTGKGIDDFQDIVSENLMTTYGLSNSHSTEDPRLYDVFKKAWRLNPPEFLDNDLEMLLSFCSESKKRPSNNIPFSHKVLNDMEEAAMKMNLVKFYYSYRRELLYKAKDSAPLRDLETLKNTLCFATQNYMAMMQDNQKALKSKSNKKEKVRFHESS